MIALDTNLLVYAHRADSPHHAAAAAVLRQGVRAPQGAAVPWPCVHEFLAVVTHSRIYAPPSTMAVALASVGALADEPGVHFIGEGRDHVAVLTSLLASGSVVGPRVYDARIAAICLAHGIDELWSADRDFSWFPQLHVVNPLARPQ
ncbi:MAG: TA system VapC family ribonuclease toxin [Tetrasphaera sp.]